MDGVGMGILLNVAETIASFLAERTGNNIFDKASGRRKIKKVLKEDFCKGLRQKKIHYI